MNLHHIVQLTHMKHVSRPGQNKKCVTDRWTDRGKLVIPIYQSGVYNLQQ